MRSTNIFMEAAAVCLISAGLWIAPARAADDGGHAAIRGVIERQIDAFRHDDAGAAFAFASPALRQQFGTQDRFLEMVRKLYQPVYRPRSFTYGETRDTPAGVDQVVRIQDQNGIDWDALYSFEREPDGTWAISGCRLVKAPGESV